MQYVIQTTELTKIYPNKIAVNKVSLHVGKGDIYGLIGKNGAGKTTLMKMILGLTFPSSGKLELLGESEKFSSARGKFGSLIEDPGLYGNCSGEQNLKRFAVLYGADQAKIPELLRLVGLEKTGKKKVKEYSLGMKQRLGIALSLLNDPEIMVLDEPMNGLDPEGIRDIRDVILKLNAERGVTFIISSHILDELAKVVNVYGIMKNGVLVEEIDAAELEKQCAAHLIVSTNDNQKATEVISEAYPEIKTEVVGDNTVVTCSGDMSAAINTLLIKSGLEVYSVTRSENDFENFFIERMG